MLYASNHTVHITPTTVIIHLTLFYLSHTVDFHFILMQQLKFPADIISDPSDLEIALVCACFSCIIKVCTSIFCIILSLNALIVSHFGQKHLLNNCNVMSHSSFFLKINCWQSMKNPEGHLKVLYLIWYF